MRRLIACLFIVLAALSLAAPVRAQPIDAALQKLTSDSYADTVEAIGETLYAGTNCGSCRAEIRGIIDGCQLAAAE